jgi:galactonate dehydratase
MGVLADGECFDSREAMRHSLAGFRAVRDAVGDGLELMVDLHARLSPEEAIWYCRELEPLNMMVVEDPIRSEHPAAYRNLRSRVSVPLAAGEQWAHKWEFQMAIEEELIDYARVDICNAAGLTEARKIAGMAETHYIKMLPHNPLGPICTAACLHFQLAVSNCGPQEVLFPPAKSLPDVFQCDFEMLPDRLTVPTAPGLGVTVDLDAAGKHPADMTEPPHFHRPDGSLTNY